MEKEFRQWRTRRIRLTRNKHKGLARKERPVKIGRSLKGRLSRSWTSQPSRLDCVSLSGLIGRRLADDWRR